MNILAVDTCAEPFSAALLAGGKVHSIHKTFAKPHDEVLLPQIAKLLKKAGLKEADLDGFVAASGPGRFTGIRVGMAYAAVAASVVGKPALSLARFAALAHGRPEKKLAAVIPGFRGEKYLQLYENGKPKSPPEWLKELPRLAVPVVEGEPTAAQLLAPAEVLLRSGALPKFEPLYLKPAGYERAKSHRH